MTIRLSQFVLFFFVLFNTVSAAAIVEHEREELEQIKLEVSGFTENLGQMKDLNGHSVPFVLFKLERPGVNLWVTETGLTYQYYSVGKKEEEESEAHNEKREFTWERVDMNLIKAQVKRENILREDSKENYSNYFYPHCSEGVYEVKSYEKITIKEVYNGIDWVLYLTAEGEVKYDFVVHSNGNPAEIKMRYESRNQIGLKENGDLKLTFSDGTITENKPVSFYDGQSIETNFSIEHVENKTIWE